MVLEFCDVMFRSIEPLSTPPTANVVSLTVTKTVSG
jgi:hypothetical protein